MLRQWSCTCDTTLCLCFNYGFNYLAWLLRTEEEEERNDDCHFLRTPLENAFASQWERTSDRPSLTISFARFGCEMLRQWSCTCDTILCLCFNYGFNYLTWLLRIEEEEERNDDCHFLRTPLENAFASQWERTSDRPSLTISFARFGCETLQQWSCTCDTILCLCANYGFNYLAWLLRTEEEEEKNDDCHFLRTPLENAFASQWERTSDRPSLTISFARFGCEMLRQWSCTCDTTLCLCANLGFNYLTWLLRGEEEEERNDDCHFLRTPLENAFASQWERTSDRPSLTISFARFGCEMLRQWSCTCDTTLCLCANLGFNYLTWLLRREEEEERNDDCHFLRTPLENAFASQWERTSDRPSLTISFARFGCEMLRQWSCTCDTTLCLCFNYGFNYLTWLLRREEEEERNDDCHFLRTPLENAFASQWERTSDRPSLTISFARFGCEMLRQWSCTCDTTLCLCANLGFNYLTWLLRREEEEERNDDCHFLRTPLENAFASQWERTSDRPSLTISFARFGCEMLRQWSCTCNTTLCLCANLGFNYLTWLLRREEEEERNDDCHFLRTPLENAFASQWERTSDRPSLTISFARFGCEMLRQWSCTCDTTLCLCFNDGFNYLTWLLRREEEEERNDDCHFLRTPLENAFASQWERTSDRPSLTSN